MIQLEVGNLNGIVVIIALIMVGPPVVLTLIGFGLQKNNAKAAKVFYILSALYLLIGLGICGSMMA
ncbi:hypothetical protein HNQ02_000899 [Flavobacterium sp. 7E]|uniref:hypothetical protein n=1 Tax=unclassified Flavobacterium TaxID=196869 RepID=UPI00156E088C|nr:MULTISPECIES: hypothetical protein [unclassified Flavobacterium]MBE0392102.1 hypothetical protein [Flavobacterium sp. PL002]NRS87989.1 hypothetical protein [Flavobacterium sp. 7E]NRT14548.1 hypothetical protein [Flavobacterium sp. 28A]